jgi:aryl-alcohol dehydrogenase-like predicted oxidoreductase
MQQWHSVGGSGVEISRIGLGGYELGPEPDEERDPERAAGVIRTALDCGVNWLDTSENYLATHNEKVIGEALQQVGSDFLVASKVAPGAATAGAVADGLRPIAEALDAPVAQVAIAWALHRPGVTAAIAGSRGEAHTRDNAGASGLALSSEILHLIEELVPLGPTQVAPA